jgi:hypothetical protein
VVEDGIEDVTSPIVFNNGVLIEDTSKTDVVCFYLDGDGDAIYARIQRNNFETEYTLNSDLKTTLTNLCKVDRLHALGQDFLVIYAVDDQNRPCVYTSRAYPPWATRESDSGDAAMSLGELLCDPTIIMAWWQHAASAGIGLGDCLYDDLMVHSGIQNDSAAQNLGVGDLLYDVMILETDGQENAGLAAMGLGEVVHTDVTVDGGSLSDAGTLGIGLGELTYTV